MKNNTTILCDENNCTACSSCINNCPKKCICFKENYEGFSIPSINYDICIHCKVCTRNCPILNPREIKNYSSPKVYAAYNLDESIRLQSTSGGVFTVFAEYFIANGGIVIGAAMEDPLTINHTIVTKVEDLAKLRGSKYVQSNLNDTFIKVRQYLETGIKVLFSGTPCQVAGLYSYLRKEYPNLTTIDVICHGVGSPYYYYKYIRYQEEINEDKIHHVEFRNKINGWEISTIKLSFVNKKPSFIKAYKDYFMKAFYRAYILKKACYNCQYASLPRISDITLGDFWGIQKIEIPESEINKGISLVLLNNNCATNLWIKLHEKMYFEEKTLSDAIKGNQHLRISSTKYEHRDQLFTELFDNGIQFINKKYLKINMKTKISFLFGGNVYKLFKKISNYSA